MAFGTGQQERHGGQFCHAQCCRVDAGLVRRGAGCGRCGRVIRRVGRSGCIGCTGRVAGNARGIWSERVGGRGNRADMRLVAGCFLSAAGYEAQAQQAGHGQMQGSGCVPMPGRAKAHAGVVVLVGAQRGVGVGSDGRGGLLGVLHRTVSAGRAGPMVAHLEASACAESRRREVFLTSNAYAKGTGWIRNNSSLESLNFGPYRSSIHALEWMP